MIDLSILICSVHTRYQTFGPKIAEQVWTQYAALPKDYQDRIEILMLTDNKKMMLGQKRNVMVDMAQGKYVQFIDDDDRIEPDMFRSVLDAIEIDPADVITFLVSVILNGGEPKICEYSLHFKEDRNTEQGYERIPNHICAVRRELATRVSFPNRAYGEDNGYSKLLRPLLASEHHIHRVLYHYDWSEETTEAQEHRRAALRMRKVTPLVDVVMMSRARTTHLKEMTQRAIDTCIAGANSLPIGVTVMEQQPDCRYEHARTVYAGQEFNYNHFANMGAGLGFAGWILVANNDLVFHDGWLHALLAADHPIVSPKSPRDLRQAHITENTMGYDNAVHLSGWCYLISRQLWYDIGGFDDDVAFWCSDDVVIEQVRAQGIAPMMVPGSIVDHLTSSTLRLSDECDELTWRNVEIFNRKYGRDKFMDDPRYLDYLDRIAEKEAACDI